MVQETEINVDFFASGYCVAHEKIVNPKQGSGKTRFYAVWAIIHIPNLGYIMFDTGYSNAFRKATNSFPNRFYRWATPITLNENQSAIELLRAKGIDESEIKYIIVSHFHADHIAGLRDFPTAKIICSKVAFEQTQTLSGITAVSKGIVKELLPKNIKERILYIEEIATTVKQNEFGLVEYQLMNIANFTLLLLPGHAKGMLGFHLINSKTNILYATDAAWDYECFKKNILPSKLVKLFFDSWNDYVNTIEKLKQMEKSSDNIKLLFTHCVKTLNYISNEV